MVKQLENSICTKGIIVTGFTKTDKIVTRTEIQILKPNINDTLMHCPERINYVAINIQVFFHKQLLPTL